jgi:STAS-like domain of unknown function (DUF4325)
MIRVLDIVASADTADQGLALLAHLLRELRQNGDIVVSFDGLRTATPSFINASFVELLRDYPLDEIKRRVKIIKSTRLINQVIKERLSFGWLEQLV